MPSPSGQQFGTAPSISGESVLAPAPISIANGGTLTSDALRAEGLPVVVIWVVQTTGALGLTIKPQFLNRPTEFEDLAPPVAIPGLNIPVRLIYTMPTSNFRLQIVNASGGAAIVKYRLAACIGGGA